MNKLKLDKEKQEIIKFLIGEELYNDLYWYQKWFLQIQLKDKDVKKINTKLNKIKEFIESEKNEVDSNTRST